MSTPITPIGADNVDGRREPRAAANPRPRRASQTSEKGEDPDDTMRNLRKTFAGVFGDM